MNKIYQGERALVTGASAGLGRAFCEALAARGADLVITARRGDRLAEIKRTLEAAHGVSVTAVVADLAQSHAPKAIFDVAGAPPISIVINNAGFGLPDHYLAHAWETHQKFITLMVTSYTHIAHLALPQMLANEKGRILNVASLAGLIPPAAGHTLYSASKSFLIQFSQALDREYGPKGVKVCALCPGLTLTEFHDVNGMRSAINAVPQFAMMDAEAVADQGLRALERGQVACVPGAFNKAVAAFARFAPRGLSQAILGAQSQRIRKNSQEPDGTHVA
ncbi:MAG: SDR family oxidoreductase [Pseudomonadota bacterium]